MSLAPDVRKDPLAPLEFVVTFLSAMIVVLLALSVAAAIFGSGSFVGLGETAACADFQPGVVPYGERDLEGRAEGGIFIPGLRTGASFSVHELAVCEDHPGRLVKTLSTAGTAAPLLLFIGFLVLSRRLIREARRSGVFTTSVAARTRTLGWYLLSGSLMVEVVRSIADGVVARSAVRGISWDIGLKHLDLPLTLLVVALGIITVARVLRQAVELQDDVDATI
jgi:hypothetical protein